MATINLYHGGATASNPGYAIYPRPPITDDGDATFDRVSAHKAPAVFGLTREVNFCDCAVQAGITAVNGSGELVAGDIFRMAIVPARMIAKTIYYEITGVAANVTFQVVSISDADVTTPISGVLDAGTGKLGSYDLSGTVDVNPRSYGIELISVPAEAECGDIAFGIHLGIEVLDLASPHVMVGGASVDITTLSTAKQSKK